MKKIICLSAMCSLFGCNQTTREDIYGKAVITSSACNNEYCETALRIVEPKEVKGLVSSKSSLLGNAGDTLIVCVVRSAQSVYINLNACNNF